MGLVAVCGFFRYIYMKVWGLLNPQGSAGWLPFRVLYFHIYVVWLLDGRVLVGFCHLVAGLWEHPGL